MAQMDFRADDWPRPNVEKVSIYHFESGRSLRNWNGDQNDLTAPGCVRAVKSAKLRHMSFLDLPPEVRNQIYGLVIVKPHRTAVMLDDDREQPNLSLTCQRIQAELLSYWLGRYKWVFWLDRHGKEHSFSPLMEQWMRRAGPAAAQICHLEINARMPDHSRFCWEVKVEPGKSSPGTMQRVLLQKKPNTTAHHPIEVVETENANLKVMATTRPSSSKMAIKKRDKLEEAGLAREISNILAQMLHESTTGLIGIGEVDAILTALERFGLSVPQNLTARNPSWTGEQSRMSVLPQPAMVPLVSTKSADEVDLQRLEGRRSSLSSRKLPGGRKERSVPALSSKTILKVHDAKPKASPTDSSTITVPAISRSQFKKAVRRLPIPTARYIPITTHTTSSRRWRIHSLDSSPADPEHSPCGLSSSTSTDSTVASPDCSTRPAAGRRTRWGETCTENMNKNGYHRDRPASMSSKIWRGVTGRSSDVRVSLLLVPRVAAISLARNPT